MTAAAKVRVHLLCWTDEPWDLEQTLFSLVSQQGVEVSIHVHRPGQQVAAVEASWKRLAPLGGASTLELVERVQGPWPSADAVSIWIAGTVATPDHFARAHTALLGGASLVVAEMRRVGRQPVPGHPPYVLRKTRRTAAQDHGLAELEEDPAFLGRCVFSAPGLPDWIPVTPEEHRSWARNVWSLRRPVRLTEPPLVDLPDLRPVRSTRWRDLRAELDYQVPRWLERRIPVTFTHGQRWILRLRRLPGKLRGLLGR